MNPLTIIMLCFSVLAAIDRICGNKFGLGKEFEKGFMLLGTMALSMIGMIVISPVIADLISPVTSAIYSIFNIDPSVIPAILFANDMGGAPLAKEIAMDPEIGMFNALIVSSMLGATVSFTIPYAIGTVKPHQHNDLLLGLLCGIVTIPVGCLASGLILGIGIGKLLLNLLPLVIFSAIIAVGIVYIPKICVKIFSIFGIFMKALITVGLVVGVFEFLLDVTIIEGLASLEEGAMVCVNASAVMSGAFPMMYVVSKLLKKPLKFLGGKFEINETSAFGFVSTLATNATTFEMMENMDKKGVVLNSAFLTSAAFVFAGHLAFTMAFDESYVLPMIIGKIIAGITSVIVAVFIYKRVSRNDDANNSAVTEETTKTATN